MYIKKVKYEDFNGVEKEKTLMFNLSQKELTDMNYSLDGGMQEYFRKITEAKDEGELVRYITELILKAYGEKSGDGDSFIKEDLDGHKLADRFKQTAAFEALWVELSEDANATVDFFVGILPAKVRNQLTPAQIAAAKRGEIPEITQTATATEDNQE